MKKISWLIWVPVVVFITACNQNGSDKSHDMSKTNSDTLQAAVMVSDSGIKTVSATYAKIDAKTAASVKEIVDHYLHIKNALANDKGKEAADGGNAMLNAIRNLDKSLLTAEQKAAYDKDEEDLKENAEHIGKNAGKIAHQRSHFADLSEGVYNLVRDFGAGRPLYNDFCPMARDKQGAMWLSELKEVKNPYFGSTMLTCGKIQEVIK